MTLGRVLGDERRRNEEMAVQVVDVVRWRLLLILVTFLPCTIER